MSAIAGFSNLFMPSTIYGAVKDATTGDNSVVGSMIEGNKGLGNPYANFAFDMLSPIAIEKGLRVGAKGVQGISRFLASPYTGKWTQIGNKAYRLKPGYAGMNNI